MEEEDRAKYLSLMMTEEYDDLVTEFEHSWSTSAVATASSATVVMTEMGESE